MARAVLAVSVFVLVARPVRAQTPPSPGQTEWSIAVGYGFSVHLNGGTSDEHQVLILPTFGLMLSRRLEYLAEGHVGLFRTPEGYMLGVMPLGARFFVWTGDVEPYLSAGAGLGWTDLTQLPEIDRRFNFLLQASLGVRGKLGNRQAWSFEVRLDHISNGGTAPPNLGLNTVVFLVGWHFR